MNLALHFLNNRLISILGQGQFILVHASADFISLKYFKGYFEL